MPRRSAKYCCFPQQSRGRFLLALALAFMPNALVQSALSREAIHSMRSRVLSLIARPQAQLMPKLIRREESDGFILERWRLHSEPGAQGRVPVLILQRAGTSSAATRLPVVCVLHGTGETKEQMLPYLERYANQGYLSCAIDSRYHGERGRFSDYVDALVAAYHANERGEKDAEHPFMYDSTWDMMRVIDWLVERQDVDPARIGLTGISLGGMHAWLTAAADPRVAASAPLLGVQGYRHALDNNIWHARVGSIKPFFERMRKALGKNKVDREVVEKVWKRLCPGLVHDDSVMDAPSSLKLIAPRPLLIANGEKDMRCPEEGVRQAVESALEEYRRHQSEDNLELYFEPGGGHAVTSEMWRRVDDFFAAHLLQVSQGSKRKQDEA